MAYQGLEEENLDQKSPGPPGWGLMKEASPLPIGKRKLLKSPLEILWIDATSSSSCIYYCSCGRGDCILLTGLPIIQSDCSSYSKEFRFL